MKLEMKFFFHFLIFDGFFFIIIINPDDYDEKNDDKISCSFLPFIDYFNVFFSSPFLIEPVLITTCKI